MTAEVPERVRARLVRVGFHDSAKAGRLLGPDGLGLWAADVNRPADSGASAVVSALGRAADPDLAALTLARLAETAPDRELLIERLKASSALRMRMTAVVGTSSALGDHLVANPDDWHVLDDGSNGVAELVARPRPTAVEIQRQLLRAVGVPDDQPPPWGSGGGRASGAGPETTAALARAYRRLVLHLAADDLAGLVPFETVAAELSDLAGGMLSAALAMGITVLSPDAAPCRLSVIAMGKCGGRELNYVSDVDVVFLAETVAPDSFVGPDASPLGPHDLDETRALRTATVLASTLMRICGQVAWQVDAGLRPEGKNGPLVRSTASYHAYYERWASTWEFQALLKSRPVAGDIALGQAYVDRVARLVWTAADRPDFVPEVQAMRRRVEDHIPGSKADRQVKLGRGGLRDVEFAVQLLQMVHGRADESLRSGTTLTALAALAAGGYVNRRDAASLTGAYRWLRTVEHRLQLQRLRRTAEIPADPAARQWLARSLGYRADERGDPMTVFDLERRQVGTEVRRIHEKLFYRPLLNAVARVPTEALRLTRAAAGERLTALGFADPARAMTHIEALTDGVSRAAAIQRTLLPAMLESFSVSGDPDSGLLSYRRVSEALRDSPWYLGLLRDEGLVAERLAYVLGASRFVADLLGRAPEVLRMLAADEQLAPRPPESLRATFLAAVGRRDDWDVAAAAVRALRRQELVRIACADLLGLLDIEAVGLAVSAVDDATLAAALDLAQRSVAARRRLDELPFTFLVVAMGRLGGEESGYASDADVMFVHEPLPGLPASEGHKAVAVATAVAEEMRRLLALPGPDPPLQVDAGLRPEGRQGPLVRSLAAYAEYYARWSSVWEAQALLRARPVAGDADLGQRFVDLVAPVRYPVGGPAPAAVTEIRRIKARVDSERLPRGADPATHTKLGRGGLADVEWTTQLVQLRHAADVPALRTTQTIAALRAAADAGVLAGHDAAVLIESWSLASRVRNAVMLVTGKPGDSLPGVGRDLLGVMRAMGYPPDRASGEFVDEYRRTTRRARSVVERVFFA